MTELPTWFDNARDPFEKVFKAFFEPDTPIRALQIGVYKGDATEWLVNNTNLVSIDDVDTWLGTPNESGHRELDFNIVEAVYDSKFSDNPKVIKHKMTSNQFFATNTKTFNFIYIDGDHTSVQTAIDGLHGLRSLEVGGLMAFDDYGGGQHLEDELERPKLGIDLVTNLYKNKLELVANGYQIWVTKTKA